MNKLFYLLLLLGICFIVACEDDDDVMYSISIMSPDTTAKHAGDTMHLHINFDEINGGTIHYINVRIYERDTGEEIYNAPTEANVKTDGHYEHHDDVVLNVEGHSNWILEARVWGEEDDEEDDEDEDEEEDGEEYEVIMTTEFHVHPM